MNIFLIIVGDGYLTIKHRKKFDWINNQTHDPSFNAWDYELGNLYSDTLLLNPTRLENMNISEY